MTGSLRMAKLDFFTMKSQLAAYLSLVVIIIMFGMMNASILALGFNGAWYMALMSCTIFAVQEKNGLERLYGSVSLRWKDVVFGRYAYLFLSYCVSFVLIVFAYIGFALFRGNTVSLLDISQGFGLSLLIFTAIIGVQVPMFFRMGYTKARAWVLLPYLIVIGLIAAPWYVGAMFGADRFPSLASLVSDVSWLISFNKGIVTVVSILISCGILFLSYKISIIAYRNQR